LETEYQWFVGIDWGGEFHQVCVLDRNRRLIGQRSISHGGEGLAELGAWLNEIVAGVTAIKYFSLPCCLSRKCYRRVIVISAPSHDLIGAS
jgi:hypothetical protein